MTSTITKSKKLPPGWSMIENTDFVSALDATAKKFVDRCIAEFDQLFGQYTRSDSQVVVLEDAPGDKELTRVRTMLHDQGRRNNLLWINDSVKGRVVCLEIYPKQAAA